MSPLEIPLLHNFLGKIMLNHQSEHPSAIPLLGSVVFSETAQAPETSASATRAARCRHKSGAARPASASHWPRLEREFPWDFPGMGTISWINMRRLEAQAKSGLQASKHYRKLRRTGGLTWFDQQHLYSQGYNQTSVG